MVDDTLGLPKADSFLAFVGNRRVENMQAPIRAVDRRAPILQPSLAGKMNFSGASDLPKLDLFDWFG